MRRPVTLVLVFACLVSCGDASREKRERRRRAAEAESTTTSVPATAKSVAVASSFPTDGAPSVERSSSASAIPRSSAEEQAEIERLMEEMMLGEPGSSERKSCEDARRELGVSGSEAPSASATAITSRLNRGTYLQACGIPSTTRVDVCSVYDGAGPPKGVTVTLTPGAPTLAACVELEVRSIRATDPVRAIMRTTFAASP